MSSTASLTSRTARQRVGLLLALVLVGELPLLFKFFADLRSRPQYDFFPLILIGAVYLAWDRLRDAPSPQSDAAWRRIGAALLSLAFVLLALGTVLLVRWFGAISAWLALAGCVCWTGGLPLLRAMTPSLALLLTIIPPPMHEDEAIALTLRQWAVWASGRALDLVEIPHVITGTLINVAGHRLGVEDACSGIHSLMAVVAVTLMLGFYWHRPVWRIITLTLCSILFVVWANILRIALGAYLIIAWKIDILGGSAHELLGLILFILCIALSASLDQLLVILRPQPVVARSEREAPMPPADILALPAGDRMWAWGIAGAFVCLGILSLIRFNGLWESSHLPETAQFNLPANLAGWARVDGSEQVIGRPEILGQHSSIWSYRQGPRSALVAFDYPFPGYHTLATCYLASGWQIAGAASRGEPNQSGNQGMLVQLQLERPSPAYAYLVYGCCDEQGRWLGPDLVPTASEWKLAMQLSYERAKAPQAYQVQVLMQGFDRITEEDRREMNRLFLAARQQFAEQLVAQVGGAR